MIDVLLVAPSPALRAGLRSLLSTDPEIRIVEERSRWGASQEIESEVEVVVTPTTSLPSSGLDGDEDAASLVPVLFIGDDPSAARRAARTPVAWGALPQEASAAELCAAVRALAQGLVVGTSQLLFSTDDQNPDGSPLTEREAEVLRWLARGLANKQIAAELGISEHTVKFHVSSIYTKLNATNRTQAVREGLRNGWIPL